jgi:hypothetical protein
MPVTTRRQSRGLPQPNAFEESVREKSANGVPEIPQESDDDDAMDEPLVEFSSSDEDEEHGSVWDERESDVSDEESNDEGDTSESDGDFEGICATIKVHTCYAMMLIGHIATPPMAKRRKLEKAEPPENTSSPKPPSKTKRRGLSHRVQGRLQNMLSLPLDVLFMVYSGQLRSSFSLLNDHFSDILGAGTYGYPEPRPHEQSPATSSNVAQVYVNLDSRATGCRSNYGS